MPALSGMNRMIRSRRSMEHTVSRGAVAADKSGQSGFTLVETIAVLLVLGIVTAVVLTKSFSLSEVNETTAIDQLKTVMRYAQIRSMSVSGGGWGISYGGNVYTLFNNKSTASTVTIPGEDGSTATLPAGTTFAAAGTLCFREFGEPSADLCATEASGNLSVSVGTKTITVYHKTGYIP